MTAFDFDSPPDDPWAAALAPPEPTLAERLPVIDWHDLWAQEVEEEWIVYPVLPARRLVAIYSAPKLGKSLLMLEIAAAVSLGRRVLGYLPDRSRRVLYVDYENDPRGDIRTRLTAMGYGPSDLDDLLYLSFPNLGGLDTDRGGRDVVDLAVHHRCEVVVVDTISRSVDGEENDNDTWLRFYRHTGLRLKQHGIAFVRLDHSGKNEDAGMRGGSAKSGDVDAVWRLSRITDETLRLENTAARMPIAEKSLVLTRETTPRLRHVVEANAPRAAFEAKVAEAVTALDEAGAPWDTGAPTARELVRAAGVRVGNQVIAAAVRERRGQLHTNDLSADTADTTGQETPA